MVLSKDSIAYLNIIELIQYKRRNLKLSKFIVHVSIFFSEDFNLLWICHFMQFGKEENLEYIRHGNDNIALDIDNKNFLLWYNNVSCCGSQLNLWHFYSKSWKAISVPSPYTFVSQKWTDLQLSLMIIYNSAWSILKQ